MKIAALTLASFVENARKIAGDDAEVTTVYESIQRIETIDLLLVFLHPTADGRAWTNERGEIVVTAEQLAAAWNLHGAVAFVGACYGLENEAMLNALKQAGVRAIIAGEGINLGGDGWLSGADIMAGAMRSAMQTGMTIENAWHTAIELARVAQSRGVEGAEDALAYRLLTFVESPKKPRSKGKIATLLAGLAGLFLMLLSALAGGNRSGGVMFSPLFSPIERPAAVTLTPTFTPLNGIGEWDKSVYVNGVEHSIYETIQVSDTTAISMTDFLSLTENLAGFRLSNYWIDSSLQLDSFDIWEGSSAITSTGAISWYLVGVKDTWYGMTTTYSIVTGTWNTTYLYSYLDVFGDMRKHGIRIDNLNPAPTPTATPTITPRPTRYVITPVPFGTATPNPTVLCCEVTPGARVPYHVYIPFFEMPEIGIIGDPWTPEPEPSPNP